MAGDQTLHCPPVSQVAILKKEINKVLMQRTIQYLESASQVLAHYMVQTMSSSPSKADSTGDLLSDLTSSSSKLTLFRAFVTRILSRAVVVRADTGAGDGFMFQIPETVIAEAMDVLGQDLRQWGDRQVCVAFCTCGVSSGCGPDVSVCIAHLCATPRHWSGERVFALDTPDVRQHCCV